MLCSFMAKNIYSIIIASTLLLACKNNVVPSVEKGVKPTYGDKAEALYMKRYNARGKSQAVGLKAYDTLAPVLGTKSYVALPNAAQSTISQEALNTAKTYVENKNTSAFMVWRNGAVESENYFGEFDKDSLIVSKSLAKPLATIAIGRTIKEGHIKSLNQPVSDFITEWKGTPKEAILVKYLLDMRTGLFMFDGRQFNGPC